MDTDIIIVGAGVIGCAIAARLSEQTQYSILVLEKGPRISEGITSRNSGVIHAGIYYPPHSLKAQLCIEGNHLLYDWCRKYKIHHQKMGKWIVGQADETEELEAIYKNAIASNAPGLRFGDSTEIEKELSHVRAKHGIFSAETGIVDQFEFCDSLRAYAIEHLADFIFNCEVTSVTRNQEAWLLMTTRGEIRAQTVINCAGLYSDDIANMAEPDKKYTLFPCRGDYFRLSSKYQFQNLVYPVKKKNAPGLGIHVTVDLRGFARLGPDAEYVAGKEDFSSREGKIGAFFEAAGKYLKDLKVEDLSYDSCGIRPKLRSPQMPAEVDFNITKDRYGFINLVGIESPGLTASMAIGKYVEKML